MEVNFDELGKKLHEKLDSGIDRLKTAKAHLENFPKETEAAIQAKIDAGRATLEEKRQEVKEAKAKLEGFIEEKKAETQSSVAEWKANRDRKKLDKRAERAQRHAEACIALALFSTEEAALAILEATAARKDADDAASI